jgi:hypothetical protein
MSQGQHVLMFMGQMPNSPARQSFPGSEWIFAMGGLGLGRYNRRLSYDDSNPQVSYGLSSSQAERVAGVLNVRGFKLAGAADRLVVD